LQRLYETILGKKLDKRNFRKKMGLLGILRPLRDWRHTGRKPARLYAFIPKRFEKLKNKGILFRFGTLFGRLPVQCPPVAGFEFTARPLASWPAPVQGDRNWCRRSSSPVGRKKPRLSASAVTALQPAPLRKVH